VYFEFKMSRLIVKNLPPKTTEDKLRQNFCAHGLVTDVQLKYTKEGKFRNFAFVGFKSDAEAEKAQKFLNNSYLGAAKIQVEVCANLGDHDSKPRAWSKYASDSSAFQKIHETELKIVADDSDKAKKKARKLAKKEKQKQVDSLMDKYKDDGKFQEFLRVQQGQKSSESWNNDAILQVGQTYEGGKPTEDSAEEPKNDEEKVEKDALDGKLSDLAYLKAKGFKEGAPPQKGSGFTPKKEKQIFFTVKLEGLPYTAKKRDVKKFFGPNTGIKSIRVPINIRGKTGISGISVIRRSRSEFL
jgi:multiple RNA-binding domain-containing protein 1